MAIPIGETAALVTAALWTVCSILFASAGKRIGALSVNAIRIVLAVGFLGAAHIVVFGTLATGANSTQLGILAFSGVLGLALGDFGYFGTLIILGPRRGTLLMSLAPIFAVITGYLLLGELLGPWTLVGIAVTLSGIFWVIWEGEEKSGEDKLEPRKKTIGVLAGLGGSACQGVAIVVSKYGMVNAATDPASPLNPLTTTLIRMVAAAVFILLVIFVSGRTKKVVGSFKDIRAMKLTTGGAFTGPFLGVWLSMVAVTYAAAGVAATLMSLIPVMVIPVVWVLYRQKTSPRGIVGACITVCGVAMLFLL